MCVLSLLISLLINIVLSTPLNTPWPPNPQLVPTPLYSQCTKRAWLQQGMQG